MAAVDLTDRHSRIAWALLAHKRDYDPRHGIDQHLSAAVVV